MSRQPIRHASTSAYQDAINQGWDELSARQRAEPTQAVGHNRYDNDDTATSPTPNPNDVDRRGDGSSTADYQPTGNYGARLGNSGFGYGGYYSPDQQEQRDVNRRATETNGELARQRGRDPRR